MIGDRIGPVRGLLVAITVCVTVLAVACSGASGAGTTDGGAKKAAASSGSPASAGSSASAAGDADKELIEKGKVIFQKTAGGVGCQLCHGPEARGDGAAGVGAPYIRGADKSRIRGALRGGVPAMQFIKLTEAELEAVAAYVQSLGGQ